MAAFNKAAFGLSSKMIICDVVVIKTISKPERFAQYQKESVRSFPKNK